MERYNRRSLEQTQIQAIVYMKEIINTAARKNFKDFILENWPDQPTIRNATAY